MTVYKCKTARIRRKALVMIVGEQENRKKTGVISNGETTNKHLKPQQNNSTVE